MNKAALTFALTACWSGASTSKPVAVAKPTCPNPAILAELAQTVWGTESTEGRDMLCVPVRRDGKSYYWLEGPAPKGESHYKSTGQALLDEQRAVVWRGPDLTDTPAYSYGNGEAVDLDGDGNDEVLYRRTMAEGGISVRELIIVHLAPTPAVTSIDLGMGGIGMEMCEGEWTLVPNGRGKVIEVTRTGSSCNLKEPRMRYDAHGKPLPLITR